MKINYNVKILVFKYLQLKLSEAMKVPQIETLKLPCQLDQR